MLLSTLTFNKEAIIDIPQTIAIWVGLTDKIVGKNVIMIWVNLSIIRNI